jgi:predicted lipoprotein with Yx(FWY)xxD motif
MRHAGRVTAAAMVAGTALLSAACSNGTSITTPFATTAPVLRSGPEYEVTTGRINGIGRVIVDGRGLTLYMYETDVRGRPSRCYDLCAVQWPPVVLPPGVSAPVAGPGAVPSLLGTAPRADGSRQVTYNGWPLYLWPPDRAPGKATGQALTNAGGLWYVLTPAGKPVVTPAA